MLKSRGLIVLAATSRDVIASARSGCPAPSTPCRSRAGSVIRLYGAACFHAPWGEQDRCTPVLARSGDLVSTLLVFVGVKLVLLSVPSYLHVVGLQKADPIKIDATTSLLVVVGTLALGPLSSRERASPQLFRTRS